MAATRSCSFKPAPIAPVFGGTILAGTAGYLKSDIKDLKRIWQVVFKLPLLDNEVSIRQFVRLVVLVKSGGVLELDRAQQGSDDAFLDQASVLPRPVSLLTL